MPNNLVMPTPALTRLRDDRGFLLVEVLVSAMLLVVASLAIMTALDKSDALAGNQQKRTIAANVAQAELERIRSLPIEDVANLRKNTTGKRTERLNGTNFIVNSEARWLTDGKDTVDCTASNGGLDYLKVTTEVSWPGINTARPASLTTIVTPSNRSTSDGNGSLSVSIVNAAGVGIASLPVQLTGTEAYTDPTDAQGCVAWGDLDASSQWQLEFGISGYVDQNGNPSIDDTIALAGGTTTVRQYQYDRAGYAEARFRAQFDPLPADPIAVKAEDIAVANSQMTSTRFRTFAQTDTWNGETASPTLPLFPFAASPYTTYAGRCAAAQPPAGTNPQRPSYVNIAGGANAGHFVYMPALNITVNSGAGTGPIPNATVKVTDACGTKYTRTTGSDGKVPRDLSAFPFFASGGTICAYNPGNNRRVTISNISNNSWNGAAARTINNLGSSTTSGMCP